MTPVPVKVVNRSTNPLPAYQTLGAAGLDLCAHLPAPVTIHQSAYRLIPTGLYVELPVGYELQIRPRSGLALKHGITLVNSPGTIDSDYRGEIGIILINHGELAFTVTPGMRIAQAVLTPVVHLAWVPVAELSDTERGSGGFGHTGTQS